MAYTNTTLHQTKVWEKKPRNGWSVVYEISPTVESRGVIVIYLNLKLNLGKNMYLKKTLGNLFILFFIRICLIKFVFRLTWFLVYQTPHNSNIPNNLAFFLWDNKLPLAVIQGTSPNKLVLESRAARLRLSNASKPFG